MEFSEQSSYVSQMPARLNPVVVECVLSMLAHADFKSIAGLQQEQPQFYQSLAGHLQDDDRNMLQTVVQQAEQIMIVAQQQQQAMGQGAANGGAS